MKSQPQTTQPQDADLPKLLKAGLVWPLWQRMRSVPQITATNRLFFMFLWASDVSLCPVHHGGDREAARWRTGAAAPGMVEVRLMLEGLVATNRGDGYCREPVMISETGQRRILYIRTRLCPDAGTAHMAHRKNPCPAIRRFDFTTRPACLTMPDSP